MNRDEIIHMAQKAGAVIEAGTLPAKDVAFLERFAALVAAAERESCADICDHYSEIREINTAMGVAALNCADLIRARGDA
jgi:hypothetical protein